MAASTASLVALVERLDEGAEKGRALAVLTEMAMLVDDADGVNTWADRAVELADRLDLPAVRVHAQIERGSQYLTRPSTVREGVALLDQSIDEAADARTVGAGRPRPEQSRAGRLVPPRGRRGAVVVAAHARRDGARRVRPVRRQLLGRSGRPGRVGRRSRRRADLLGGGVAGPSVHLGQPTGLLASRPRGRPRARGRRGRPGRDLSSPRSTRRPAAPRCGGEASACTSPRCGAVPTTCARTWSC